MAATYDLATDIGKVRLLISDTDVADPANAIFEDEELDALLTLEAGSVRLAAAQALDTIASNEVLVSKVIRTQDLSTDGSKVSAELRARAAELRRQVDDGADDPDDFGFGIVEFDPTPDYWLQES